MNSWNTPRPRRPYQRKTASKAGGLIFGLGLGALLAVVMMAALWLPPVNRRLENLPYYLRTFTRKLIPHPEYLPTPAAAAVINLPPPTPTPLPPPSPTLPTVALVFSGTPTPTVSASLPPSAVQLTGFTHQWQTWNNCGPATVTTNLSFFGRTETQAQAAPLLKPNKDDKNVSPDELAAYARTTGMQAIVRQGGTLDRLKTLLANNLPVLTETWLLHDGDGLGHYRLITGYDDAAGQFTTTDSLNGPDFKVSYAQFEADWRVFNRLYLVIYPPEQAELVAAILGADLDDTVMAERVLATAQADLAANPADAIAWFNQGDALTRLGRFAEAVAAFDRAREIGLHWRRLWYQFTPFEAYYAAGRYQDVLILTEATLKGTGGLEEAYYYHGLALQATGQAGAQTDFEAALAYNPLFAPAQAALEQSAP